MSEFDGDDADRRTARSTAFPQASPDATGQTPGPLAVPADHLRNVLGLREVSFVARNHPLPVVDQTLVA